MEEEGHVGWDEDDNLDQFEAFMSSIGLLDYATVGVFEGAAFRLADSLQLGSAEEDATMHARLAA